MVLGAGGVGKTTMSVTLAFAAALLGRRVALVSIDPAKRLSEALRIPLTGSLARIDLPGECSGSVSAAVLDQRGVFDEMVRRHSQDPKTAQKILNHKLYRAVSSQVAGTLEYMALAKVADLYSSGDYDTVVLDTPPDNQALEVFFKPQILLGFREKGVISWLLKPLHLATKLGLKRVIESSEKMFGGLSRITGLPTLSLIAEFIVLMQQVVDGFVDAGRVVERVVRSPDCGLVVVSRPNEDSVATTKLILDEMSRLQVTPQAFLINYCIPDAILADLMPDCQLAPLRLFRAQAGVQMGLTRQLDELIDGFGDAVTVKLDQSVIPPEDVQDLMAIARRLV